MLGAQRRRHVLAQLAIHGRVHSDALAAELDCSVETIRRDLAAMEREQLLERVHGGAVRAHNAPSEASFEERLHVAADEKRAIGQLIADAIGNDQVVYLDLGTTLWHVAAALPISFTGTAITSSLRIAQEITRLSNARVLLTGGQLRHGDLSLSGAHATSLIRSIRPDVTVLSTGAFSVTDGVTDFDFEEAQIKRMVVERSRCVFLATEAAKYGRQAPFDVCPLTAVTKVFTGATLPPRAQRAITDRGIGLALAGLPPHHPSLRKGREHGHSGT